MKSLLKLIMCMGIFLLMGTAGAADLGLITVGQIIFQIIFSFVMIFFSYFNLKTPTQNNKRYKKAKSVKTLKRVA